MNVGSIIFALIGVIQTFGESPHKAPHTRPTSILLLWPRNPYDLVNTQFRFCFWMCTRWTLHVSVIHNYQMLFSLAILLVFSAG